MAGNAKGKGALRSQQIVTGDLQENCYLLWRADQSGSGVVVFDPGADASHILAELGRHKLTPEAIVLTHCHGDHIGALSEMKNAFPNAVLYVPEAEKEWLAKPLLNLSYFVGQSIVGPPPERLVADGDRLEISSLVLKAIHVPGHSPGGTAYFVEDSAGGRPHLFCGDILFQGSIGRTDLPGGAGEEVLVTGIREKLFVLPEETLVHPGHGAETSIGEEKAFNPYCGLDDAGMA